MTPSPANGCRVDMYVGGNEHAVLHLLYARFLCMALNRIGLIDFSEPFRKFVAHGLIVRDGTKMSKSKGNVINPDHYIDRYGADVFRVYLMFMGDYLVGGDFRDEGLKAMGAFLDRVWMLTQSSEISREAISDRATLYRLHRTIKTVTADIKRFSYNTALARIMELLNHLRKAEAKPQAAIETLAILLSPFAPHLCEEIWERLGHRQSIFRQPWPHHIEAYTVANRMEYVVQINGRVRARLMVDADLPQAEIELQALADPNIQKQLGGKQIVNKIYVPGKLMNLVIK